MRRIFAACALCVLAILVLSTSWSLAQEPVGAPLSVEPVSVVPSGTEAGDIWLPLVATRNSLSSGLDVTVTTDGGRAVSKVIAPSGGSLVATGADGDTFTLTIPNGALLVTTTVTMTPVTSLAGAPVGTLAAGVHIAPDRLGLWKPATLRIASVPAVPVASEVSFGWFGAGQDFHLYPLNPNPAIVQFEITRLHGYGFGRAAVAAAGESAAGEGAAGAQTGGVTWSPHDIMAQHAQQMQDLLRQERANQEAGVEGDPELAEQMIEILRQSFHASVAPLKQSMMTTCAVAEEYLPFVLGWIRQVELLGASSELAAEMAVFDGAFFEAVFKNCIEEAAEPCFDERDPFQWALILGYERSAQLMGVETGLDLDALPKCQHINVDLNGARKAFFTAQADADDGWETKVHFSFPDADVSTVLWMHPFAAFGNTGASATVDVVALVDGTWRTLTALDYYQCRDRKAQRVDELIMTISNVEGSAPFAPQVYATDIGCWKWRMQQTYSSEYTENSEIVDTKNWDIDTVLAVRDERPLVWFWNSVKQAVEISGALDFVLDGNGTYHYKHFYSSAVLECSKTLEATYAPPMAYVTSYESSITITAIPPQTGEIGRISGGLDVANSEVYRGNCAIHNPDFLPVGLPAWVGNEATSGKEWAGADSGSLPEQSGVWSRTWAFTAVRE